VERLGILGGAFNPPHIGHLTCAQEAIVQLELDRVIFVPFGEAPHRELQQDPGAEARPEEPVGDAARPPLRRIHFPSY